MAAATVVVTHLVGVPAMPLPRKVIRLGQGLQTLRQFERLAVCKKERREGTFDQEPLYVVASDDVARAMTTITWPPSPN